MLIHINMYCFLPRHARVSLLFFVPQLQTQLIALRTEVKLPAVHLFCLVAMFFPVCLPVSPLLCHPLLCNPLIVQLSIRLSVCLPMCVCVCVCVCV